MSEYIFTDVFGDEIVLTEDVRDAILTKHPEIVPFIGEMETVLKTPDEIRRSIHDERAVLYYCYREQVLKGKWLVVVVKRIDRNFVSTFYATSRIKSGNVLWTK